MKRQVYEIDEKGYIKNTYAAKVDINGALIEVLEGNIVTYSPEQGMCRPKWTGTKWIEDMTQEEIDELKKQSEEPSFEDFQTEYNVDIDYRLSLIEMGLM